MALQGRSKDEIRNHIITNYYSLNFTLDEIRPDYIMDATCEGSVPQAIEAFLESTSFEDAIRNAVSIGGDSDTIAAIAGSIAEAYYGFPTTLREQATSYLKDDLSIILEEFEAKYGLVAYKPERNKEVHYSIKNEITDAGFVFFWREYEVNGYLSNWCPAIFTLDGVTYKTTEQYMMSQKAVMAGDNETLSKIMDADDPKICKKLGKTVHGFDSNKWDTIKEEVVYNANLAKFSQNEELKKALMETGTAILAEANPFDSVWGIGRKADERLAQVPEKWKGTNLLGKALMKVRDTLRAESE